MTQLADPPQGVRCQVVKLIGDFTPSALPGQGRREPRTVPVHVFRGKIRPIEQPDLKHPALVRVVQADRDGQFALPLPPGKYTVVAEIAGRLYLNNWTDEGSWTTVIVRPGEWTRFIIEDVLEAEF